MPATRYDVRQHISTDFHAVVYSLFVMVELICYNNSCIFLIYSGHFSLRHTLVRWRPHSAGRQSENWQTLWADFRYVYVIFMDVFSLRIDSSAKICQKSLTMSSVIYARTYTCILRNFCLGKKFKLEVWETCVKSMKVGEIASFTVHASVSATCIKDPLWCYNLGV